MTQKKRKAGSPKPATALDAIVQYAKQQGQAFNPEAAIAWAAEVGISFQDQRSWGRAFSEAARQGFIRPAGLFARATSNRSVRPGWILA